MSSVADMIRRMEIIMMVIVVVFGVRVWLPGCDVARKARALCPWWFLFRDKRKLR
jgi:hypothetical protein